MVAGTDLLVYNAENLCASFLNQVASMFYLRGGGIKKYLVDVIEVEGYFSLGRWFYDSSAPNNFFSRKSSAILNNMTYSLQSMSKEMRS